MCRMFETNYISMCIERDRDREGGKGGWRKGERKRGRVREEEDI